MSQPNEPAEGNTEDRPLAVRWAHRHPSVVGVLTFLDSRHLPDHLRDAARPVEDAAHLIMMACPDGPELTAGLRKLLEAKDCFVRGAL
jgi:hypothetical protein